MSASWDKGSTRAWRQGCRPEVLDRDGWRCRMGDPTHFLGKSQVRSEGCQWADTFDPAERSPIQVHHVHGRKVTGDDPRWCVASCQPCNLAAGDPTSKDPKPRPVTTW